jgi:hypothetical protein
LTIGFAICSVTWLARSFSGDLIFDKKYLIRNDLNHSPVERYGMEGYFVEIKPSVDRKVMDKFLAAAFLPVISNILYLILLIVPDEQAGFALAFLEPGSTSIR